MMEWTVDGRRFHIREAESDADFHAIEEIQREAWGFSDLDIVPAATLVATRHAGGIVLGAFDEDYMIGFTHAFPAFEGGRASVHSHMLAVRPSYRNAQAGSRLKLAQREATIGMGLDEVTWTFDPLQSLNAHLNFAKLGVVSQRYIVNFYGEETSSPLHRGFGTDRLWVSWMVRSERVTRRISRDQSSAGAATLGADSGDFKSLYQSALVRAEGNRPLVADDLGAAVAAGRALIEIPSDINRLKEESPEAGREWREATRKAFLSAIESGLKVEDFLKLGAKDGPRWFYLLTR